MDASKKASASMLGMLLFGLIVGVVAGALRPELVPLASASAHTHTSGEHAANGAGANTRYTRLDAVSHLLARSSAEHQEPSTHAAARFDPQQSDKRWREHWDQELQYYQHERRDSWSETAANRIETDLQNWSEGGRKFELIDVDCRTERCAAELEFASIEAARSFGAAALAEHLYPFNCIRLAYLPAQDVTPYRVTVLLKCPVGARDRI